MELHEKVRFDIGVSDHFVEPTVKAILGAARTGDVGDGKVFVLPVEKIYRIRTARRTGPRSPRSRSRPPEGLTPRAPPECGRRGFSRAPVKAVREPR